jgi:hypothetical protein
MTSRNTFDFSAFAELPIDNTHIKLNPISIVGLLATNFVEGVKGIETDGEKALERFASDNGLPFTKKQKEITEKGSIFGYGNSKTIDHCIQGELSGLPMTYGTYSYYDPASKATAVRLVTYMKISLVSYVPQLVIDNRFEQISHRSSILPLTFDTSQLLQLEGDFSTYFSVYSTDKNHLETLRLLAPNIMQFLLEQQAECDIELVENSIYFYWRTSDFYRNTLQERFAFVETFLDKLKGKLLNAEVEPYHYGSGLRVVSTGKQATLRARRVVLPRRLFFLGFYFLLAAYLFRDNLATSTILGDRLTIFRAHEDQLLLAMVVIIGSYLAVKIGAFCRAIFINIKIDNRR